MVFTAAQRTAFFENNDQMGIPHATVVKLQEEGITHPDNLVDFDKDMIKQIADNLRRPAGRIPDPTPGAHAGAMIPTPPFVFGAKSIMRLTVVTKLVRYYAMVGHPLTPVNMAWNMVMRNFNEQWKALEERKENKNPDVLKITKALPVIKWTEAFMDYLSHAIGVRMIPLVYVIRPEADVPVAAPALAAGEPYLLEHGSVKQELVAHASHMHALFREDNSDVYYKLEEATRGTPYAASIKPFQRAKQGREAWLAITGQYAGKDKWAAEIKRQEQLLHTRVWKGQSNFSLEKFIAQHRNAFVSMQACAEHIQYQLPNGHSRVGFLLDAIQTSDAGLQAAMASIRTDDGPDGMRNDFEQSAAHLLPYDPVAKKHATGSSKRGSAEVSAVSFEMTDVAAFGTKPGIGKSGAHFRYYDKSEYSKLTKERKTELREWQNKGGAERGRSDARTKKAKFEKAVAVAVEKKISEQAKVSEEEKLAGEKLRSLVASIVKETGGTTTSGRRATTIGATTAMSKPSNPMTQNWGRPMSPEAVLAKPQWNAYGLHPAAMRLDRPAFPDSSTPSTPPSLKGILKKAKNDDKS